MNAERPAVIRHAGVRGRRYRHGDGEQQSRQHAELITQPLTGVLTSRMFLSLLLASHGQREGYALIG